jgi:hypothetical protein
MLLAQFIYLLEAFMKHISELVFVMFLPAVLAMGQAITGSITGVVRDTTGAVIPQAQVTATNQATGISRATVTNGAGNYTLPFLNPGTYAVTGRARGFRATLVTGLSVAVEQTTNVNLTMVVGSTRTQVSVTAAPALVQTTTSDLGQVIGSTQVEELPLNGRLFEQLAFTVAGSVPAQYGNGDSAEDPAAAGAQGPLEPSVNGITANGGDWYMIDGVRDMDTGNGYITYSPPVDAIEEFKVETSDPEAQYGSFGGAIINVVIKSGTNQLHGELFEFLRDDALNAKDLFATLKPAYHGNQFGGAIGGPIKKNKLFFFLDFQQFLLHQGEPNLISVPTVAMRNGNLSGQTPAYNPSTGQPFPGNIITGINPIAERVANLFPLPNLPGITSNYDQNTVDTENQPEGDLKVDWQISPANHVFARESLSERTYTSPSPGNVFMMGGPYSRTLNQIPSAGWTHIFSPYVVNDFRVGYTRAWLLEFPNDHGIDENDIVGLPNGNLPGIFGSGIAQFNVPGYESTGDPGWPGEHDYNIGDITDGLTIERGSHSVKAGADLEHVSMVDTNPQDDPRGIINFNGDVTSNNGAAGTGNPYASFLLGYPEEVLRDNVVVVPRDTMLDFGPYAQDDWKITRNLTLNYGLRWDLFTPAFESSNREANFNETTGLMQFASSGNRGPNINTNYGNVSPRIGLAYSPGRSGRTAIRAAYGISTFNGVYGANGGTLERNYPFFPITDLLTPTPFQPFYSLSQGLPVPQTIPYVAAETFTPPPGTDIFEMDPNFKENRVENWNVSVQRQLSRGFGLTVAYVGTHGYDLFRSMNLNQAAPGPGNLTARLPFYNIDPNVQQVNARNGNGFSRYNGLQATLQGRYHGLNLLAAYTWSHDIDDISNQLDPYVDALNIGNSNNDVPQNFVFSYVYDLPFGSGMRFGSGARGVVASLMSGWQTSGILTLRGGYPEEVTVASSTLNNGGPGNVPNLTCPVSYPKLLNEWFGTSCFSTPALYTFGDAGISPIYAPGVREWDMSLAKETRVTERVHLRIEGDFFNITNTPELGTPSTTYGTPEFGSITSIALPERIIQLGAKVEF